MMIFVLVLISIAFAVWRFASPGHAVSASGSIEALAHVYMGFVLAYFALAVWTWRDLNRDYSLWTKIRAFPWLIFSLWFVPSMVELVLFLAGPFNPKHEATAPPEVGLTSSERLWLRDYHEWKSAPRGLLLLVTYDPEGPFEQSQAGCFWSTDEEQPPQAHVDYLRVRIKDEDATRRLCEDVPKLAYLHMCPKAKARPTLAVKGHPCPKCGRADCGCGSNCQCPKVASVQPPVIQSPASVIYVDCGCCGNRPCICGDACQCVIRSRP